MRNALALAVHFELPDGRCACGRDSANRRRGVATKVRTTKRAPDVYCASCERTKAYKEAMREARGRKASLEEHLRANGIDPEKPAAEMTRDETLAFIDAMARWEK